MNQGATSMTRYERAVFDAAMYKEESEQWKLTAEQLEAESAKLRELVRALICATDPHDRERLVINAAELLGEVTT